MNWNRHSNLEGQHAFLSASKHSWIRYSDEKVADAYRKFLAVQKGTELHDLASRCIKNGIKLQNRPATTLSLFVNDAIGFKMESEQVLYYSMNAFGTTDAISFKNNVLRIHDLKTGEIKASMEQLYIYAALFCLEYRVKPGDIKIITRIYQDNDFFEEEPDATVIAPIMDRIITADKIINKYREEM